MPSKRTIIVAVSLCTWSIISYYLLIRQSTFDQSSPNAAMRDELSGAGQLRDLQIQLNELERNIQEESKMHDYLVKKLLLMMQSSENGKHLASASRASDSKESNIEGNAAPEGVKSTTLADRQAILDNKLKKLTKDHLDAVDFQGPVIPVLVFACNRISVRNCLENLLRYRSNARQFPIIVSQVSDFPFHSEARQPTGSTGQQSVRNVFILRYYPINLNNASLR